MAWHATKDIVGKVYALYEWKTVEYFLDIAQGVCAFYLELPHGRQVNTNTLKDGLEGLGLGSITMDTFPKDGNKTAAAALFRMRNIAKTKGNFMMGMDGEHDPTLWQNLEGEFRAASLKLYGGGAADPELDAKLTAAMKLSMAEQTAQLQGSMAGKSDVEGIREATAGIHEHMARKEDTEALEKQVEALKTNLDARDALVLELSQKNDHQRRMLGDMRRIQTQLARSEAECHGLREQLKAAAEAMEAERAVRAGLSQQHNDALKLVLAAHGEQFNLMTQQLAEERQARRGTANELRALQQAEAQWDRRRKQAEAQWDRERTRLVDIATDNREAILTVLTESLLGKRSQPETQPAADAADEEA